VNLQFWSKGPKIQPFMQRHLIESVTLWFWSKVPVLFERSLDIILRSFKWLSIGFPNQVFLYGYLAIGFPKQVLRNQSWLLLLPGLTSIPSFLHKNQHAQRKLLNLENWINGERQYLAKIRVFKVDYFILPLFLVPKLRYVSQNEWKKHTYIFFLLLVQK
jgi:hypothetical protein